jgi:exosortase
MNSVAVKSLILFGVWFAAFSPSFLDLWNELIKHSNDSHGLLVPFISLYFAWQKKEELRRVAISTSIWGAVIVISSLLIYIVAFAGDVAFIARLMLVVSLIGLVLFNYGKKVFKIIAFPLFFLFFMIPIPVSLIQIISLPLQFFATTISAKIINAFSIPVSQEGNMLYFAQTQLEVAQACSGLHSIVALIMLSVIFVHLSSKGLIPKIILLASAIPLALLANIIRVSGTGILAHYYGSNIARGFLHEFSGLAVFAFGFLTLALEYLLLNKFCNHDK